MMHFTGLNLANSSKLELFILEIFYYSYIQQALQLHSYLSSVETWACLLAMPCWWGLKRAKQPFIDANSTFRWAWLVHQTPNILRYSPRSLIYEQIASLFASVLEKETPKINEEGTPLNTSHCSHAPFAPIAITQEQKFENVICSSPSRITLPWIYESVA